MQKSHLKTVGTLIYFTHADGNHVDGTKYGY